MEQFNYCSLNVPFSVKLIPIFSDSFFPVHPVSMNNTNRLLSSDNKGYASYVLEMEKNPGTFHGEVRCSSYLPLRWHFSIWELNFAEKNTLK